MIAEMNPDAVGHPPAFFSEPGSPDTLLWIIAVVLLLSILGVGLLFLRIHTLPERIAHKREKLQFEIVAVLGLLALFTHIHWFWIAGLILALIDMPDFTGVFRKMAGSLDVIASNTSPLGESRTEQGSAPKREQERSIAEGNLTDA